MVMSCDDFLEWRNSPTTKEFMKFLQDSRQSIAELYAATVLAGDVVEEERAKKFAAMCAAYQEVIEVGHDDIIYFYQKPQKED